MNRIKWGEMLGDQGKVVDDLRWSLFQSERIIQSMREDKTMDQVVFKHLLHKAMDAKIALAALWS